MKSLTILPFADTPNLIVREIESYDVKAFSAFMMQPRYQRYTAMRLRSDAEVAAFVLRSVARQGDDRRNVFHLAAEERSSGEAIGDGFLIMQRDRTIELGWNVSRQKACGAKSCGPIRLRPSWQAALAWSTKSAWRATPWATGGSRTLISTP
jgi:hypothetical protein